MANRPWPYSAATSVGTSNGSARPLLSAILAAGRLDEISTAEGAIESYIRTQGHVDEIGRLRSGLTFWVYPTGGKGPYEETESGEVLKHGLLVTIERGAWVDEAVRRAEEGLPETSISHLHVASVPAEM